MARGLDSAGLQGGAPGRQNRQKGKAPAKRAWSKLRWWLTGFLAVFGGLVLIGTAIFVIRLDIFGRMAADQILANAIEPSGREMPPTAGALPYASADIQIIGGMGQGLSCSLPWPMDKLAFPVEGGNSPIGLKMRQACAYHDYCYRHGAATYGYTQADCDFALQVQAYRMCAFIEQVTSDESGREKETKCVQDARLVTLGVRVGGSDAFRPLNARDVLSIDESGGAKKSKDYSTYFEFDPYPTKSADYKIYRIADAPPIAGIPPGRKAIYRFRITPSGARIFYSTRMQEFTHYADIAGNPHYLTSPPVVVRTNEAGAPVDWFVWWQRVDENQTTGRLLGLAPGLLRTNRERSCFGLPTDCATSAIFSAQIGMHENSKEDPELDQLHPADLGPAAAQGISMATLRHSRCIGKGNAPCYVHVLVKTVPTGPQAIRTWQPQEPLSINDRLVEMSKSHDRYMYRNFAALPFVLDPPGADAPVIAWTRRDDDYQNNAILRRAAVGPGVKKEDKTDDVAIPQGTVYLQGFSEDHEPAFILGRSTDDPVLVSLAVDKANGSVAAWSWPLPSPDPGDTAQGREPVKALTPCRPGLEAEWLHRPPQILGRKDGSALAIFSLLRPHVSTDWTVAKLRLATLKINRDGSCPVPAKPGSDIALDLPKPAETEKTRKPIAEGRDAFVRISRAPILIADLDGDGREEVMLADGPRKDFPLLLCSITETDACITPSDSQ